MQKDKIKNKLNLLLSSFLLSAMLFVSTSTSAVECTNTATASAVNVSPTNTGSGSKNMMIPPGGNLYTMLAYFVASASVDAAVYGINVGVRKLKNYAASYFTQQEDQPKDDYSRMQDALTRIQGELNDLLKFHPEFLDILQEKEDPSWDPFADLLKKYYGYEIDEEMEVVLKRIARESIEGEDGSSEGNADGSKDDLSRTQRMLSGLPEPLNDYQVQATKVAQETNIPSEFIIVCETTGSNDADSSSSSGSSDSDSDSSSSSSSEEESYEENRGRSRYIPRSEMSLDELEEAREKSKVRERERRLQIKTQDEMDEEEIEELEERCIRRGIDSSDLPPEPGKPDYSHLTKKANPQLSLKKRKREREKIRRLHVKRLREYREERLQLLKELVNSLPPTDYTSGDKSSDGHKSYYY